MSTATEAPTQLAEHSKLSRESTVCSPFIKWPGGKRILARKICTFFPGEFGRYIEPFVGGGAIFFTRGVSGALLADIDTELINVYEQVRDNVELVISQLSKLKISRDYYYKIRSSRPSIPLGRAIRFLYLNRTAFNGIYRVNRNGDFNVPFGCKPGTKVCEPDLLRQASKVLASATLKVADFETTISCAGAGDLIYADPPYTTKHDDNGFRRYNRNIFSWQDQIRLAGATQQAAERGATVLVSNAHHQDICKLYQNFQAVTLVRSSCVSGRPNARGPVKEYLFVSTTKC